MEETRAYPSKNTIARDLSPYEVAAKEMDEAQQILSDSLLELAGRLRPLLVHAFDGLPEDDTSVKEIEASQHVHGIRSVAYRTGKDTEIVRYLLNNLEV